MAMATYPSYWPETVRGLLTHSAEWTDTMRTEIRAETAKKKRALLLKRYGWGVPNAESVLTSSQSAVSEARRRSACGAAPRAQRATRAWSTSTSSGGVLGPNAAP